MVGWFVGAEGITTASAFVGAPDGDQLPAVAHAVLVVPVQVFSPETMIVGLVPIAEAPPKEPLSSVDVENVAAPVVTGTVAVLGLPYTTVRWSPLWHVLGTVTVHGPAPVIVTVPGSQVLVPLPIPSATVIRPVGVLQPAGTTNTSVDPASIVVRGSKSNVNACPVAPGAAVVGLTVNDPSPLPAVVYGPTTGPPPELTPAGVTPAVEVSAMARREVDATVAGRAASRGIGVAGQAADDRGRACTRVVGAQQGGRSGEDRRRGRGAVNAGGATCIGCGDADTGSGDEHRAALVAEPGDGVALRGRADADDLCEAGRVHRCARTVVTGSGDDDDAVLPRVVDRGLQRCALPRVRERHEDDAGAVVDRVHQSFDDVAVLTGAVVAENAHGHDGDAREGDARDARAVVRSTRRDRGLMGSMTVWVGSGVGAVEAPTAYDSTSKIWHVRVDPGVEHRDGRRPPRSRDSVNVFPADHRQRPLVAVGRVGRATHHGADLVEGCARDRAGRCGTRVPRRRSGQQER